MVKLLLAPIVMFLSGCTACGDICERTSLQICVLSSSATEANVALVDQASRALLGKLKTCVTNDLDTLQAVQVYPLIEVAISDNPVNPVTGMRVEGYAMVTYLTCKPIQWVIEHEILHAVITITKGVRDYDHERPEWECINK